MRGQAEGEFSHDVPAMWGASRGRAARGRDPGVGEGRIPREDAHALLIRSAIGALRPG